MSRGITICAIVAACAVVLTIDELARPSQPLGTWIEGPEAGAVALLMLVPLTMWLCRRMRPNATGSAFAKAAFTLSVLLPLMWFYRAQSTLDELFALPDADLPPGWADRVGGDWFQTQIVALLVSAMIFVCILTCWLVSLAGSQRVLAK